MKRQQEMVNHHYIHQAVCEGSYSTDPDFNKNKENLKALITYIELLEPSLDNLQNAVKLVKFYRFPIVMTFRQLYQNISKLGDEDIRELEDHLKEISSRVASFIELAEIKLFEQIQFIFQWGKGKKKFKFTITKEEKEFAEFIYSLSKQKRAIIENLRKGGDNHEDMMTKLDDSTMKRSTTPFEDYAIQYIKQSAFKEIEKMEIEAENIETERIEKMEPSLSLTMAKSGSKLKPKSYKKVTDSEESELRSEYIFKKVQKSKNEHDCEYKNLNERGEEVSYEEERQLPMCCRRFFKMNEVLDQPENLKIQYKFYNYPFRDRPDEKPGKAEKLKKTLCGFLNAEGGIVFFGIKQNADTKKRQANGYNMSEKTKINFRNTIFGLLKDVKPDAQSLCMIKWVPIKSGQTKEFLHGRYIPKVIIEKGAKDNLYSYVHEKVQKFAFKTENEFLIINQAQKILKMFHDKLRYPERIVYKLHDHPCKEPLVGKPVYEDRFIEDDFEDGEDDFPSIYGKSFQKEQIKQTPPKLKFRQKGNSDYLIIGLTKQQIKSEFSKEPQQLGSILPIQLDISLVKIYNSNHANSMKINGIEIYQVYPQVRCQTDQKQSLKDIVKQIEYIEDTKIQEKKDSLFCFKNTEYAACFWLKVKSIGYIATFTPQT